MVNTGLSDVIGSWKIIPICAPRTWRISSFDILRRSCPEKTAVPAVTFPGGDAIRPRTESIVTLLPHPLSPTTPRVSLSANPNETPLTACMTPSGVLKVVSSPCTSRMKSGIEIVLFTMEYWNKQFQSAKQIELYLILQVRQL